MKYLLILLLISKAYAYTPNSLDQCARIKDNDDKNMCIATATLSTSNCEKIHNTDKKLDCFAKVRDYSREVNWQFHKK